MSFVICYFQISINNIFVFFRLLFVIITMIKTKQRKYNNVY